VDREITRRTFNTLMTATAIGGDHILAALTTGNLRGASPNGQGRTQPERGVAPNPRCFVINGKSVFLRSGSIHYSRCPHELWRDRMLRAKRAGLNCIATYIPWNFHESEDGVFSFDGDRDIGKYVDTCQDLGLYCFLRVGPFICGEWDCGGYPAWLLAKPGIEFRTMNQVALPYIRRWFERLIAIVASRQVTRGGPVIMVQAENEWLYCDRPGGLNYLEWLVRTLRELGVEVLITDCNGFNVSVPGSFKMFGFSEEAVRRFRKLYPEWPAMIYEFYPDWGEMWGQPSMMPNSQPDEFYQRTMHALSLRAMLNYYTFHGGTNFGFWASNTWKSDHSFITTRYYFNSPVYEGGALDETYFASKSSNLLAASFNDFFCQASESPSPVRTLGPIRSGALRSPQGFMIFIHPEYFDRESSNWYEDGQSDSLFAITRTNVSHELALQPGIVQLPSGKALELAEGSKYPLMLPFEFQIDDQYRINFSNATLVGTGGADGRRVVVLRGEAGRRGILSINGREVNFVFSAEEPVRKNFDGVSVLGVSREDADRTWLADGKILIGPAYVGHEQNGQHECYFGSRAAMVHTISRKGEYRQLSVPAQAAPFGLTSLSGWRAKSLPEIQGGGQGWRDIEAPKSVEELGEYYGYTWYRAFFDSDEEWRSTLFFTRAADRFHVFQNGKNVGVWGRGPQATRDPLAIQVTRGRNEFVFLCDNMGRLSEGKCMDHKGILNNVYLDAVRLPLGEGERSHVLEPPNESWEFRTFRCYSGTAKFLFSRIRFLVPIQSEMGATLAFRWIPQYVWIYVNGLLVGEHGGDCPLVSGLCFNEFLIDPFLSRGHTEIELVFYGEPMQDVHGHVLLFTYPKSKALGSWQFKRWRDPITEGQPSPNSPAWWECEFERPGLLGPLFLVTQGLSKGQAYLNGKALGRYWEIGPQHSLYMPEPWIKYQNRLAIFDEAGSVPDQVSIIRDPAYPHRRLVV
jgi:beta-galactosidase